MDYKKIVFSKQQSVAKIVLSSAKNLNAIDAFMVDEIMAALETVASDPEVKVLVLAADGKGFSGGGDIRMMIDCVTKNLYDGLFEGVDKVGQLSLALKKLPIPVIASVHGPVAGAGFNVALACDFIVAAESATFIQAFVKIGLIPDAGGIYLLNKAIGVSRATELVMTGRPVDAKEAHSMGLVVDVVPDEQLESATYQFAGRLAKGPGLSLRYMKELTFESDFKDFESYLALEAKKQKLCGQTEDFKEGIMAFAEKRKPNFSMRGVV